MSYFWLFDFEVIDDFKNSWEDAFGEGYRLNFVGTDRIVGRPKHLQWIKGAEKVLKASKKDDVILCWFDMQGVICFFLSKLLGKRRIIISQNVMLKLNDSFKGRTYRWLYKIALKSPCFFASVASEDYGKYLAEVLGIEDNFFLVHDPFLKKYEEDAKKRVTTETAFDVFMGGNSSRDWNFAFELARKLKDNSFCFVLGEKEYDHFMENQSEYPNVTMKQGISYDEFNSDLKSSKIVICPVTTEAPAGLIVMYTAAANDIMFVTNKTATTSGYINEDRGGIMDKNVKAWAEHIAYYLDHDDERVAKAKKLHEWLETACSMKACATELKNLIDMKG